MDDTLRNDLRTSYRTATRHPVILGAVLLLLAMATGAASALFSVIHAALVQPVAYPEPDRLVDVLAARVDQPDNRFGITPADYLAWQESTTSFEHLGAYVGFGSFDLTGQGDPKKVAGRLVTADLFTALGVNPFLGRVFLSSEEEPGQDRVTVLSHAFWQQHLGSDPAVLGTSLTLDGEAYTVLGVMPPDFGMRGGQADLWVPLSFGPHRPADRGSAYLGAIGRLKPGVSLEQARLEMDLLGQRLEEDFPDTNAGLRPSLLPLAEVMTGTVRPTLEILLLAAGFVLLIACANVSSLLLARGVARRGEFALRSALGASRSRLLRQNLTESLVLSLAGGALGLLVAQALLAGLPDLRGVYTYHHTEIRLNLPIFAATLLITVVAGLLCGALPAWQAARRALHGNLRDRTEDRRTHTVQDALVVGEIALAFLVLVSSGLLVRSLVHIQDFDRGYEPTQLLALDLTLPEAGYEDDTDVSSFYQNLLERLSALPGVGAVAASNEPPGGGWGFRPRVDGKDGDRQHRARFLFATPDFFETVGLTVEQGRPFDGADRAGDLPVMVLDERAAADLFGSQDPLGRQVSFDGPEDLHQVVGVVQAVADPIRADLPPAVYLPFYQRPKVLWGAGQRTMTVLLRITDDPTPLIRRVRDQVHALAPTLPITHLATLDQRLGRTTQRPRINAYLITLFALLGLLLAAIGLFGLLVYRVQRGIPQIGIRMALGAGRREILRPIMARGSLLALAGLALGVLGALGTQRLIAGLLHGIEPLDPWAYLGAFTVLLGIALLASYVPARRAAGLDPARCLRRE